MNLRAHCQATPRTLFPPWWGYRAGTCAVPNPTKFFARSAGRGSLRHTPPHGVPLVSARRAKPEASHLEPVNPPGPTVGISVSTSAR